MTVRLLGGFGVGCGETTVNLSADAQRVVAFLALHGNRVSRAFVAGSLWVDGSQDRAFGNLRSALWRLRRAAAGVVESDGHTLGLAPDIHTDVARFLAQTEVLVAGAGAVRIDLAPSELTRELLPGWYEEWVIAHRERLRQRSLHALETLAEFYTEQGRYPAAIEAALAAVQLDPLREAPHRCLINVHILEGNHSEGIAHYRAYRELLRNELGIAPSHQMEHLMDSVVLATSDRH